jgi:outer membrane porin, OprD family
MMITRGWTSSTGIALVALAVAVLGPSLAAAQPPPAPSGTPPASAPAETAPTTAPSDTPPAQRTRTREIFPVLPETEILRSPDTVPPPPLPPVGAGLLETSFPAIGDSMSKLPPFFRDTDLNVHFRTFYFNRQKDNGTASEAWAMGGWIQYASGWLLDTFAMGTTYYLSAPLYAPDNSPGSLLLTPGQGTISVVGEAWGALRYKEYALLRGGRVKIEEGYLNPQDNRMVPNTFEGITLSGKLDWVQYDVGYVWTIKPRDSNDFISMSQQAGASGKGEGVVLGSLALTPIKDLLVYLGNYYSLDVFNTLFAKGEYTHPLTKDLKLQTGLQFTNQSSVGDERLGDFTTWNVGAGARLLWRGLQLGTAMHFTGADADISSPWGSWPGYLSLMVTDFDRANEKAFGVGLKYDFGGTLLPFQLPGFSVQMLFAAGFDRENPANGGKLANTYEGNLDIIYNVPAAKGLSLRFRNAYVSQGNPGNPVMDFRLIVNYELDLL